MADWEDSGHAQQGDMSHDRAGQAEYDAYSAAASTHGSNSKQARAALSKALAAGWSFSGLGPSGRAVSETGGRPSGGPTRGNGSFW